ncbi:hypothetical protein C8Q76DRAFT_109745 [Earliella scabrosa]|nr:hypothetical protein C8Q76DRAFT_109745 [Earliella scabrosa]
MAGAEQRCVVVEGRLSRAPIMGSRRGLASGVTLLECDYVVPFPGQHEPCLPPSVTSTIPSRSAHAGRPRTRLGSWTAGSTTHRASSSTSQPLRLLLPRTQRRNVCELGLIRSLSREEGKIGIRLNSELFKHRPGRRRGRPTSNDAPPRTFAALVFFQRDPRMHKPGIGRKSEELVRNPTAHSGRRRQGAQVPYMSFTSPLPDPTRIPRIRDGPMADGLCSGCIRARVGQYVHRAAGGHSRSRPALP